MFEPYIIIKRSCLASEWFVSKTSITSQKTFSFSTKLISFQFSTLLSFFNFCMELYVAFFLSSSSFSTLFFSSKTSRASLSCFLIFSTSHSTLSFCNQVHHFHLPSLSICIKDALSFLSNISTLDSHHPLFPLSYETSSLCSFLYTLHLCF